MFERLHVHAELIPIEWIKPKPGEPIEAYAMRLSQAIDAECEFGVLGVSFGGLVAVEISKVLKPAFTILISSAETRGELRPFLRTVGKLGVARYLPVWLFNPPRILAYYLFGAKNKGLLREILADTDLAFSKWAINELLRWKNEERLNAILKIGGTRDKLIPPATGTDVKLIEGGEHFMIVDRAEEVSKMINQGLFLLLEKQENSRSRPNGW